MYFLLAGVIDKFHYLRTGLAIVLTFIGVKMLLVAVHIEIPIWASLIFVALVLAGSVVASLIIKRDKGHSIDVELPPGFGDAPAEDPEQSAQSAENSEKALKKASDVGINSTFGSDGRPAIETDPAEKVH